jgi:hypothetical protein
MRLKDIVRGWQSRYGSQAKEFVHTFRFAFELENGNTRNSKSMNHWNDNQVPPQSTIVWSFAAAGWRGGSIVRLRRFRHRRALARERSSGRRSHTSLLRRREVLGDLLVRAGAGCATEPHGPHIFMARGLVRGDQRAARFVVRQMSNEPGLTWS